MQVRIGTGKGKMEENMNTISIHTVSRKGVETVSGLPVSGRFQVWLVKRVRVLIPVFVSLLAVHSFGYQEPAPEEEKKEPVLTQEEREMLEDREILENLALLKNLETIEFMDLLNEMDPDWSESDEAVIPEENEEEGQKP
jgi:hypothetical protein